MQKKIELLAPAKSFEAMMVAYKAGADAVYAGGQKFSARAYANNFNQEEVIEAIKISHLFNKKFYLAINTIFKQNEIENGLFNYLKPFYENGLDACIIQDLGVLNFVKKYFPNMDIHISTQASINSYRSAILYKELGANRIVPAREMSLSDIKKISDNVDIEIESFVHGALCYSYSGQCLFSSMLGSRSGNRGRCAQPCRMAYDVISVEGRKLNSKQIYPLSLKDMCTIDLIPQLIRNGVNSFKIEGRMKSLEYVATITSIYRKYIDIALSNKKYELSAEDKNKLLTIYNRGGFSKGYYSGLRNNMVSQKGSIKVGNIADNNKKLEILKWEVTNDYIQSKLKKDVKFKFIAKNNDNIKLIAICDDKMAMVEGIEVQKAKNSINILDIKKNILSLGNSYFKSDDVVLDIDEGVFFPIGHLKKMRRDVLDKIVDQFSIKRCLQTYEEDRQTAKYIKKKKKIYASVNTISQFRTVKTYPIDYILLNIANFDLKYLDSIIQEHSNIFIELPIVYSSKHDAIIDRYADRCGYVIKNMDILQYIYTKYPQAKKIIYSNMNINNSYAFELINDFNIYDVVYPLELTDKEIIQIKRAGHIYYAYGKVPLMVTRQRIKDVLSEAQNFVKLRDRKNIEFNMKEQDGGEYSVILNSVPHYLIDVYKKESILLDFTEEKKEKIDEILYNMFNNIDIKPKQFTRGHYSRMID